MKFSDDIFALTKDEADKLQNRRTAFMLDTKINKSVRITLVTTYGAVHNKYWKSVSSEIFCLLCVVKSNSLGLNSRL